ncbi:Na+ dependent nucleoside transporter C-terminus-domain-containing protein [Coniella lustricola]|uniref:Na+ dependent nucleoside transporter C-terminus-domain-containing protein n=1 Tax=Coniella lustricola TaxID=2025994 RepID=A0A2T3A0T8_9PEZI|nr:Na+ dependent nucleoside transporter C-terminus-domain-containing protein [Coniella lustricola]
MEEVVSHGSPRTVSQTRTRRLTRIFIHIGIGGLVTGWWIAGLVLHRKDKNWIVPFLIWLAVISRLIFWHFPAVRLVTPFLKIWRGLATRRPFSVHPKWALTVSWIIFAALVVTVAVLSPEFEDNNTSNRGISVAGLFVTIGLLTLTSKNRKRINWYTVLCGLYIQFVVAAFVLRTTVGADIFGFLSEQAASLLGFASNGLAFLTDATVPDLPWFAISVVPPIIFFAGLASLLSYWGMLQWLVTKAAVSFHWLLEISGAEAIVAACSPFFGQGESVMLIQPFLDVLTPAELHQVMCSGFATIAGSVLAAYIGLGLNGTALISSCVMSIPASIVVSKLRYPETDEPAVTAKLTLGSAQEAKKEAGNWMHAFTNGCWLGLKLAGIVAAVLASVIALIDLCDALLSWAGKYINAEDLTLEYLLGYLLVPVSIMLGVPRNGDLIHVGRLIGVKFLRNEFLAYRELQENALYLQLSPRSRLIATYSLCGFGNLGSLGTQVGLMSQLAPRRNKDIANVAFSALLTGVISTLTSAGMAGILLGEMSTTSLAMARSNATMPTSLN